MAWMIAAGGWVSPALAEIPAPIPAHQSTYVVFYNDKAVGEIDFVLEKANESVWHVRTDARATAFLAKTLGSEITEASHFYWQRQNDRDQVVPLTYHQVSREPFGTRFWQHHYHWEQEMTQTLTHQGEQTIDIRAELLDPLTLRLQLASDLTNEVSTDSWRSEDRHYWVLDRDDVERQRIEARGQDSVEVPAGCFDSQRFYRFRKEGSSRNYDLWVAESLAWLPVKMVQTDGSRQIRIELASSDLLQDPPSCAQ